MDTIVSNESTAIRVLFFSFGLVLRSRPHVGFWGGGLKNDLESNKKSWIGEAQLVTKSESFSYQASENCSYQIEEW